MQTSFTDEQRQDPDIRLAESILRKCVHCGFCLATCPTYLVGGDERDSPRGRIYLMKEYFESGAGAKDVQTHLDRCLTCGSCETTCPSGVDYLHLADLGRTRLADAGVRARRVRWMRKALLALLTREWMFRAGLALGRWTRRLHGNLPRRIKTMTQLLPETRSRPVKVPAINEAQGPHKMRVVLHLGCVQKNLKPGINEATVRVLTRLGCEVVTLKDFGCCGALADHLGENKRARKEARRNIKAILEASGDGFDAIVSNASGCGIAIKDYGHLFRADEDVKADAEKIAEQTLDISELLERLELGKPHPDRGIRVAYQASCTLNHGQRVHEVPKALLRHFGYEVVEPKDPHLCCGFAGTYSILEPARSNEFRTRKAKNLEVLGADVVASGNIGCITGLGSAMDVPVLHMIELIDQAMADLPEHKQ